MLNSPKSKAVSEILVGPRENGDWASETAAAQVRERVVWRKILANTSAHDDERQMAFLQFLVADFPVREIASRSLWALLCKTVPD